MTVFFRIVIFCVVLIGHEMHAQRSHYGHAGYHGGGHGTHGWHDHYSVFYGPTWGYSDYGSDSYPPNANTNYFGPHLNPSFPINHYRGDPSIYTNFEYPSYPYRGTYYIDNYQHPLNRRK
jgi:hypothetical protein